MPAAAQLITALVIGISDGDTMTVLQDHQQVKIRLAEVDAPEKAQPFGTRSRQSLADLCFKAQAEIRPQTRDRYGRTVARVTCNGIDASQHQVGTGMAWAYTKYLTDPAIKAAENQARAANLGLWVDPNPVPPWDWRKSQRH